MKKVRVAAQAGRFYPEDPDQLKLMINSYLEEAKDKLVYTQYENAAFISPHAGYIYSGPVAAYVYSLIEHEKKRIKKVVLIGPSHWSDFKGFALSSADVFRTPLGDTIVDQETNQLLIAMKLATYIDAAHELEHSLEVQLPFLQYVLDEFVIIPILVGRAEPQEVATLLEAIDGSSNSIVIASSDLSHYLDYHTAQRIDKNTVNRILSLDWMGISADAACGHLPLKGLLIYASKKGWRPRLLDLRNSGDTAGPMDKVVGYVAIAFERR